jgi:AAA15 family ATPase/GTPase
MLRKIGIKNFKSIKDIEIDLGRINIFIGENGCGKSNILEAVAMAGATVDGDVDYETLYGKGVRVSKPNLMFSSFIGKKTLKKISLQLTVEESNVDHHIVFDLSCKNKNDIFSEWGIMNLPEIFNIEKDIINKIHEKFTELATESVIKIKTENPILENLIDSSQLIEKMWKESRDELVGNLLKDKNILEIAKRALKSEKILNFLTNFIIYNLNTKALRGILNESKKQPLGINGENLDMLISYFDKDEMKKLSSFIKFNSWLQDIKIDSGDILKLQGHKLGKSSSILYFEDKYMQKKNNIFSAENANEGVLHILFYLALFISKKTPSFFAIDNIEQALNPQLCRNIVKEIAQLSADVENPKQALITTHNPAVLDGLNLNDDEQRLFRVYRNDDGETQVERIKMKPNIDSEKYKLSELWMRGHLGALPTNF